MSHISPSETAGASSSSSSSSSLFDAVTQAPDDAILGLDLAFKRDPAPNKLNLGVGAYRTSEGAPYLLNVVQKVEAEMVAKKINHEYSPIDGQPEYYAAANRLIYGADSEALAANRVASSQGVGGTGALRLAGAFIARFLPGRAVYIPRPTWGNHTAIFANEGIKVQEYAYYYPQTRGLDLAGMLRDIDAAPEGSVILLHACAHNPTGVDPTMDEWHQILQVIQRKKHVTLFDCAYQGFATGDLDNDVAAIRLFVRSGIELFVCQSFSKNLGLYGERTGCVSVVCSSSDHAQRVQSQLKIIVRAMYSNPPIHGARIAARVLNDPALFAEWVEELKVMSGRLREMRERLHAALVANGTPGDWTHILKQIGMFTYTGLTPAQVKLLVEKYHIYLLANGRISMAGIKPVDCQYLADAIHDAVVNVPAA